MHVRCYDETYHSYHRYGGRGIIVCADWHIYNNFKQTMWETWFEGATVDRINNDGNYQPENCRWLSKAENKKPYKDNAQEILMLYETGLRQKDIGVLYYLTPERARHG